jgi:peptidylprolyl isomerase
MDSMRRSESEECLFICLLLFLSAFSRASWPGSRLAFSSLMCDAFRRINNNPEGVIMPEQAKKGDTAYVHYTGRLESGEVFDSSEGGDPLEFEVGSGQVIQGFDEGVNGMAVGDQKTIEIEPGDAYGQRVDALIQAVPRGGINLDREPEVGMRLGLQLPDGNEIPVTITEVTQESITIDANHPLAGQKLIFDLTLVNVK